MNPIVRAPYAAAGALARLMSVVVPGSEQKLLRSFSARRGLRRRYREWASRHRDQSRPLLWVHAPSVGEGLQARPVLALLRERHPEIQLAYTFFSPSAESFAKSLDVDFADYLDFDTASAADFALDTLRPTALVFSKLDVWPLLAERAAARRVGLGLVAATVSDLSSRSRGLAPLLLGDSYRALDRVGAVDALSAERLVQMGVRTDRIVITGDTRADQVIERAARAERNRELLTSLGSSRFTLVAGSTWPADESRLFDAWQAVRKHVPTARLVIAPHEPRAAAVDAIVRRARGDDLTVARLGAPEQAAADVVIVDRVGVLGDLYAFADAAYVGGGFHAAGLHSVLEPAAFAVPVLFGPQFHASRDAANLIACHGGWAIDDAAALSAQLLRLCRDTALRTASGQQSRNLVEQGAGAAARTAALVESLIAERTAIS